jgi:inner membrane transporter RhtA
MKPEIPARAPAFIQPWMLVVVAVTSVQFGAAIAKQLFDAIGFGGVVFLRAFLGGLVFLLLERPRLSGYTRTQVKYMLLYGAILAANMLLFYSAIERIPLGIAVAIAFAGPLVVSVAGSRRLLDLVWVALAAVGILLLSPITDVTLDIVGLALAATCGLAWGLYIIITKRASGLLPGNTMLAFAMLVAAVVASPFGAVSAAGILGSPALLGLAVVVVLLSSVVPFGLEFMALKRLTPRAFGLLVSLEPAAAAVMGWVILQEHLGWEKILGIAFVTIAAAATTRADSKADDAPTVV